MNFEKLLEVHKIYGTSKEDIIKREGFEEVLENVVIAPCWSHLLFADFAKEIKQIGEKAYNVLGDNFSFSFIEMKNVGAPAIIDEVLSLGVTKCKNLLFIGSAGALSDEIKIGDLAVPVFSYNGVGACRYFSENLEDDFEKKDYPDLNLTNKLLQLIKEGYSDNNCHNVINYSVDAVFTQFPHIDHFIELGVKTIEMETSATFRCSNIAGIKATALFCISDNTIKKKSLYSGRNEEERAFRHHVRKQIIPKIVIDLFKNN